jgi:cell division transport system permease protein
MGTFRYVLRDTNRLLFRHWGLSLLTLFTAVAVFFLVGSSALFMLNTRYLVARVESELLVQAYVKSEAQLQTVADKAHKIPGVASVRWVTTAEAMGALKARLKGHAPGPYHPGGESPSAKPGDRASSGPVRGTFRGSGKLLAMPKWMT